MPASETSPLLSREPRSPFPSIDNALLRLGGRVDRVSIEDICLRDVGDICKETAFRLVVLLELRARKLRQRPPSDRDVWSHSAQLAPNEVEKSLLDEQVIKTWELFLDEYRTTAEIEQVLWASFAVDDTAARLVRVVDLLNDDHPSPLICHQVVILSLADLWHHAPSRALSARTNSTSGVGLRYDAICTPRVLHAVDLAAHLTYFSLLVSYVLHPPSQPTISGKGLDFIGPREILLMVFSASILIRPRTLFNIPFAVTLLLFLFSLPAVPFAGSLSFYVLLFCFAFHAFEFHYPHAPSPLFLFKVQHTLPFAGFLAHGFSHIVFPIVLFFIPIGFLATFWLSMALADTFFAPPSLITLTSFAPTPIETRTTVLMMFFGVCFAVFCSLFIFVVQGNGLYANVSGWDVYSPRVGRDARVAFVRTVVAYSSPYTFPAPFSILQAVLIGVPSFALGSLGFRPPFAQAEKLLWRMTVGPVGLVFGLAMFLLPN
ncbi:hypothetical protein DFH07DRAFT_889539 [Mycena maculata]|uniref:Uncharacterized protein n=1 Tax=Mycena maculata TaxID=230809 RepID=A0AAD7IN50_9AGAR|nr:hypothetical protein DFH07DRAFT_889539 [Mycena maculata]